VLVQASINPVSFVMALFYFQIYIHVVNSETFWLDAYR